MYYHIFTSHRVCASGVKQSVLFVHLSSLSSLIKFVENLKTSNFEGTTIPKQEVNTEVPDTVACLYLI